MPFLDSIRLRNVLVLLWLAFAGVLAIWAHLALGLGAFHPNQFDGALFLLQVMYAARGLKPYVDYGFLYPPGPALLFGQVLHLRDVAQVLMAVAVFNAAGVIACVAILMKLARRTMIVGGAALVCLGAAVPMACMSLGADPCPITLSCLCFLLLMMAIESRSRWVCLALAAAALVSTLWRWERALAILLVFAVGAAGTCLTAAAGVARNRRRRLMLAGQRVLWPLLAGLVGVGAGLGIMAAIAVPSRSWAAEKEFVFALPLVILSYRRLPILLLGSKLIQPVAAGLALLLLAAAVVVAHGRSIMAWRSTGRSAKAFALLAGPLALLPYSVNRADPVHFLPLTAMLLVSLLAAAAMYGSATSRWLITATLGIVLAPSAGLLAKQAVLQQVPINGGVFTADLKRLTTECSSLIPTDSQSLFVGQKSYKGYVTNIPLLYVAKPDLRPATRFISDEPGVQNTCRYGSRVASELQRAPRPMAVVLDESPWSLEPNLSAKMASCGRIESELASELPAPLGTCTIGARSFEIGVIR